MQIADHNFDGAYKIQFRNIGNAGKIKNQTEYGLWGISGSIHFTITQRIDTNNHSKKVDPRDATFYDAYEIIKLTKDICIYKSVEFGDKYTMRRVDNHFIFPK